MPALLLLLACAAGPPDDSPPEETGARDSATDSAPLDSQPPTVPHLLRFFGDGERLTELPVTVDGQAHVSDAAAELSLDLTPGRTVRVEHQPEGFLHNIFLLHAAGEATTWELTTSSHEKLALLPGGAGVSQDPALGVVVVSVFDGALGAPFAGARVSLEGHTGQVLLPTPQGFLSTDTLTEDSLGLLFFANATPGEATITITPPLEATCGLAPGAGPVPTAPVAADGYTAIVVICAR